MRGHSGSVARLGHRYTVLTRLIWLLYIGRLSVGTSVYMAKGLLLSTYPGVLPDITLLACPIVIDLWRTSPACEAPVPSVKCFIRSFKNPMLFPIDIWPREPGPRRQDLFFRGLLGAREGHQTCYSNFCGSKEIWFMMYLLFFRHKFYTSSI